METTLQLRVAVVGSRTWPHPLRVQQWIASLAKKHPSCIVVSGGAPGVDRWAEGAALAWGLRVESFRPERLRDKYVVVLHSISGDPRDSLIASTTERLLPGIYENFRDAAFARNGMIVEAADQVAAFHWQDSPGTWNTRRKAEAAGKTPILVAA